jgi:hypothetical protein
VEVQQSAVAPPTRARRRRGRTLLHPRRVSGPIDGRLEPEAPTPQQAAPVAAAPPPQIEAPPHTPSRLERDISGARLLIADARTGFILLNAARYRAGERLFGLPPEQVNIATLIALGALAEALHDRFERLLDASTPTPGDLALGTTVIRQAMLGPSAPAAPQAPVFGALVVLALSATVVGPSMIKSVRGIKNVTREIGSAFAHRYGRRARGGPAAIAAGRPG